MPRFESYILQPAAGMKSKRAGRFLWQLDDQSRRLTEDTRGATPEELGWQLAPGMNTIGMLLAHIAVVEVSWIRRGVHEIDDLGDGVLPIGRPETGMPLPADAAPPPALDGKSLAFFDDLLMRSRDHTRRELAALDDADLDRHFRRRPKPDAEMELSIGWMLYHLVEHEAGHYYQINLLRHAYRLLKA